VLYKLYKANKLIYGAFRVVYQANVVYLVQFSLVSFVFFLSLRFFSCQFLSHNISFVCLLKLTISFYYIGAII